jgi:hypothetical protein
MTLLALSTKYIVPVPEVKLRLLMMLALSKQTTAEADFIEIVLAVVADNITRLEFITASDNLDESAINAPS